ncbi:MAG: NUDIX domain-containing protein [Flavobacteriaceae bacterium]|nr:NUDIX domain-containing protein [Flavobacteriaceae bacterium]
MFTVFINDYPIYLTDNLQYSTEINFFRITDINVLEFIKRLEVDEMEDLYLYDEDIEMFFEKFKNTFKVIEAAGGVVINSKNERLFIYRNNIWDLPKGKIENSETIEQAAVREVEEETGVKELEIIKALDTTYHIYKYKEEYVFKISYWFEMKTSFTGQLLPQFEEGITKVEWLNEQEIKEVMKNTYANIKLLVVDSI